MTAAQQLGQDRFCSMPDGRQLCYRIQGPLDGEPLIMIAGLGLQLTYWPNSFIAGFISRGFQVITLDNRDAGRSSSTACKPPTLIQQLFRLPSAESYDIGDMADDVVKLMKALGLSSAHVLGMSMGGMIGQTLAARNPARVRTLTSIFSTTGSLKVGQPSLRAIRQIIRRPPGSREESANAYVDIMRLIGSSLERDEAGLRAYACQAWDRGGGTRVSDGVSRQIGAIIKSGDRTKELSKVLCRTLVLHGDKDLMVATSGGYATAAAISGAQLILLPGLGHDMPKVLIPRLLDLICGHMNMP
jgi:pimeloyl-ACP methyl ester carboxylesterase